MTIWQIFRHPIQAQSAIAAGEGWHDTALGLMNELEWLESGPGIKRVDGGFVCRYYPLNVQPVWPTLREAIRYGRESE